MKLIYLYTLAIFVMFLFYGIARLFFDSRKSYRQSRNYIFGKALTAIVIFYTIRFGIGDQLLQLLVSTLHNMGWTDLAVPPPSEGWTNIFADVTFLLAVLGIVGFYTWSDFRQVKLLEGRAGNYEKEVVKIQFPKDPESINPIFHERIKELFELKYQAQNLQLEYDSQKQILFGKYKDGFRHYVKMIHCDESVQGKKVDEATLKLVYQHMNKQFQKLKTNKTTFLDAYYVLDRGSFAACSEPIQTLTEDGLLNDLIDFKPYLKKLIFHYENDRLFSIRQKESEKPTLAQTFVPPIYTLGKDKENIQENLDAYIDNWLTQDSQKHLVLLGDYGMGKTSFMRHYAAKLAADILKEGKMRRFPVLISLTNTSLRHGGIDKSIGDFLSKNIGVKVEVFNELVRRGKVVFLLDGFDEMGYLGTLDQRIKQLNEIWQLPQKNNKVVISGRPSYFFKEEELKEAFNVKEDEAYNAPTENPYFERLTLQPLGIEAIEASIQKYYKDEELTTKYMTFIQSNRSILDLCSRPQLMHLVRDMLPELLANHEQEKLNASELMKLYLNRWIERQISKNIVSAIEQKTIKEKFVLNFFTDLAALYYEKDIEQIPAKTILELLKEKMGVLQLEHQEEIEGLQNEMLNGFLIEKGSEGFKFVHKSFKEYLVAQKILQLIEERDFKHTLIEEKDWTLEIIDFVYENFLMKENPNNIPSLLNIVNNNSISYFKDISNFITTLKCSFFNIMAMLYFESQNHPDNSKLVNKYNLSFGILVFLLWIWSSQEYLMIKYDPLINSEILSNSEEIRTYQNQLRVKRMEEIGISSMSEFNSVIIIGCSIGLILGCFSLITFLGGVQTGANLLFIIIFITFTISTILGIILFTYLEKVVGLKLIMFLSPLALSYLCLMIFVGKFRKTIFFTFITKKLNFLAKAWHIALLKGQFKKEDYPGMVYYLEHHFGKKL